MRCIIIFLALSGCLGRPGTAVWPEKEAEDEQIPRPSGDADDTSAAVVDSGFDSGSLGDTADTSVDTDALPDSSDTALFMDSADTSVDSADTASGDSGVVLTDNDGDGFFAEVNDCDDTNPDINPDADEVCDPADVDENCNSLSDDDDPTVTDAPTWHRDDDEDGYGDPDDSLVSCDRPSGYVADNTDCDDRYWDINPGRNESCNGVDDDCDGLVDADDPEVDSCS